ncbi:MAG: DUF3859 domain-containing protein [Yoonia sp.]|mgnify:FL=1|uniref:DUF3859 domain-containing protein n=1 Tax=Yoonia sp. TaxID=2212373 RepID=UPI0021F95455|nr:DUF3859 domain-containing protein [Rhodobacteraceae bacterium S2214]
MKHVLALLICMPVVAFAQAPQPDVKAPAIASMEVGVICAPDTLGVREAPGTIAGTTHVIEEEPAFVAATRRVPAVLGIGFGIKSQALDIDGINGVQMTVTHPPMGATGQTVQTFASTIRGTDPSLTFYQFDFDYELLPGFWQIEASYAGETLYRTTFEVLPAEQIPELADICGYVDLFS